MRITFTVALIIGLAGCATPRPLAVMASSAADLSAEEIDELAAAGYVVHLNRGPDLSPPSDLVRIEGMIFFRDESRAPQDAVWFRLPSEETVHNISPAAATGGGYAKLTCSVLRFRRIKDCEVDFVDPTNWRLERAFLGLASTLRLNEASPLPEEIDHITIDMQLSDGSGWDRCHMVFCRFAPSSPQP